MSQVTEAPAPAAPVERRSGIQEVLSGTLIQLIELAPANPLVHGLILAQTGKRPGPECRTFGEIKEWVETNCDKQSRPPQRPPSAHEGILIPVDFSETEYGRADYRVRRSASDNYEIDAAELVELVEEAIGSGEGLDDVITTLVRNIEEDAWNQCNPCMEPCGEYDYEDHEERSVDDSSVEFSRSQVWDLVVSFLESNYPELAGELEYL